MPGASARRISSHADGPDVARARGHPATSAPNGPISSARSVPRRGKAPGWSCPGATPTPSAHLIEISDGGECLAIHETAPDLQILRRHRRAVLPSLEQPHDHVVAVAAPKVVGREFDSVFPPSVMSSRLLSPSNVMSGAAVGRFSPTMWPLALLCETTIAVSA